MHLHAAEGSYQLVFTPKWFSGRAQEVSERLYASGVYSSRKHILLKSYPQSGFRGERERGLLAQKPPSRKFPPKSGFREGAGGDF